MLLGGQFVTNEFKEEMNFYEYLNFLYTTWAIVELWIPQEQMLKYDWETVKDFYKEVDDMVDCED